MSEIIAVPSSALIPITAEAVAEGHPDKSADTISGLVVGEHLGHDRYAHVAAETTLTSNGNVELAGEITSGHPMTVAGYESLVRGYLHSLGWNRNFGYDPDDLIVHVDYTTQSQDIAMGVEKDKEDSRKIGAGDQGVTVGYAIRKDGFSKEDDDYLPLPISLAKALLVAIDGYRREQASRILKPDMKSQLDISYDQQGQPVMVENLVFALSHAEGVDSEGIRRLIAPVVAPVFDKYSVRYNLGDATINGTHRFVVAGARGDTGLTGRKIVVDHYGPDVPVGGGAFHGKDPTKADVTGAYLARWIAKQIVANGMADQCLAKLNWVIGRPDPFTIQLSFGGTEKIPLAQILSAVKQVDFSLGVAMERFKMRDPQQSGILYDRLAAWGPFGNPGDGSARPWETVVEPSEWKEWQV